MNALRVRIYDSAAFLCRSTNSLTRLKACFTRVREFLNPVRNPDLGSLLRQEYGMRFPLEQAASTAVGNAATAVSMLTPGKLIARAQTWRAPGEQGMIPMRRAASPGEALMAPKRSAGAARGRLRRACTGALE